MIILEDYKVIFLKNPKCAGSSLHSTLDPINSLSLENLKKDNRLDVLNMDAPTLEISSQYYGNITIPNFLRERYANLQFAIDKNLMLSNIDEYTVYVVIRDPIERFMSMCRYIRQHGRIIREILFKEELDLVSTESDLLFPKSLRMFDRLSAFSNQFQERYKQITVQEIGEKTADLPMGTFIDKKPNFDLLRIPQNYYFSDARVKTINYSNLNQEYAAIVDKHSIPAQYRNLSARNISTKLESDVLSQDLIDKIKLIYAEDVAFYTSLNQV